MGMIGFLQQISQALVVAVAAAFLTARLALGRFRSEKSWEQKAASYREIFGAIHDMLGVYREGEWWLPTEFRAPLPEDRRSELRAAYRAAESALERRLDTEIWLISDAVRQRVQEMLTTLLNLPEPDEEDDFVGQDRRETQATAALDGAIKDLLPLVQADLGIGQTRWQRIGSAWHG